MTDRTYDVFGIGSALVDLQLKIGDETLSSLAYPKGGMTLTDVPDRDSLLEKLTDVERVQSSGGSVANTLASLSKLGSSVAMAGCVADDTLGATYQSDIEAAGVKFISQPSDKGATGTCVILITPDAERTMMTTLGCAPFIEAHQVEKSTIENSKILYVEGYLWDAPETIAVVRQAMEDAKALGTQVAFSASDPFCVSRHKDDFVGILRDHADIFFANAEEAKALTGMDTVQSAVMQMGQLCQTVAVTNGGEGSFIVHKGEMYSIAPTSCKPVDTTGAGDTYAAGILHGMTQGKSWEQAGAMASKIAAEVVSRLGARY